MKQVHYPGIERHRIPVTILDPRECPPLPRVPHPESWRRYEDFLRRFREGSCTLEEISYWFAFPTPVQSNKGQLTSTSTPGVTFSSNVTAGNLLFTAISYNPGAGSIGISSIKDDQSQTWSQIGSTQIFTGGVGKVGGSAAYFASTVGGVKPKVTWTLASSVTVANIIIVEWNLTGASPFDTHHETGGSSTSQTSGATATLKQSVELFVGWVAGRWNSSPAVSSPTPANDAIQQFGANWGVEVTDAQTSSTAAVTASYTMGGAFDVGACGAATFYYPHTFASRNPAINHQNPAIL